MELAEQLVLGQGRKLSMIGALLTVHGATARKVTAFVIPAQHKAMQDRIP